MEADLVVFPDEPYAFTPDDGLESWPQSPGVRGGWCLTWYGPSLPRRPRPGRSARRLTSDIPVQTADVLLANAVALLHAAAVLFMLTGSLLALRWPWCSGCTSR